MEHAIQIRLWEDSEGDFHKQPSQWSSSRGRPIEHFFSPLTSQEPALILKPLEPRDGYEAPKLMEYLGIQEQLRLTNMLDQVAERQIDSIAQRNALGHDAWMDPIREELLAKDSSSTNEDEVPPPPVETIVRPQDRWFLIPLDDFMAGVALASENDPWSPVQGGRGF